MTDGWKLRAPAIMIMSLVMGIFFLFAQIISSAQERGPKDARYYSQQAVAAYKEKNYSSYLENLKKALSLRPNHPTIMYNLSGAHALVGNREDALKWLSRVASMGLIYPAATDDDFESIKGSDAFKSILKKFESNAAPVNNSAIAFTMEEKRLVTEGIAYDPVEETFYISSIHKRKIISVDKNGAVKEFSNQQDGLWSVLGMKVDPKSRILWACSAALPQTSDLKEEDKGLSAIFKYDLKTKKLIRKYSLPDGARGNVFGDLTMSASGEVFISDSQSPVIYSITQEKDQLEIFLKSDAFSSLQGIDLSADGKRLFVADYSKGIWAIDVKSKRHSLLSQPENVCLLGIDGCYFYKGSLIAVQNGTNPHRIIRLHLNGDLNEAQKAEVIEANNSLFDEPTLGVIIKDQFYYIANSQWGAFDKEGNLPAADKLKEPVILKAAL